MVRIINFFTTYIRLIRGIANPGDYVNVTDPVKIYHFEVMKPFKLKRVQNAREVEKLVSQGYLKLLWERDRG